MNDMQKQRIKKLRQQGVTYSKIAGLLGLSVNSVKSFCQRNGISNTPEPDDKDCCRNCGALLVQVPGRKTRRFCSPECRVLWWKTNPSRTEQATYHFVCPGCGSKFSAYGNQNRKYCTHGCYINTRFGKQVAA